MAATLYVKLEDAHALLDELKASISDSDTRVKISGVALQLCVRVDLGAMSFEQHSEVMHAVLVASMGRPKS